MNMNKKGLIKNTNIRREILEQCNYLHLDWAPIKLNQSELQTVKEKLYVPKMSQTL